MFPNTYIKIVRNVVTGYTDIGSPIKAPVTINESVYVSLLEDTGYRLKNTVDLGEAGQTTLTMFALSSNKFFDIEEKDIITNLTNGDEMTVVSKPYIGKLIPHLRATLKLGIN